MNILDTNGLKRLLALLLVILLAAAALVLFRPSRAADSATISLESILLDDGQVSDAFARALLPGQIEFPRDLGPHEDFQTEWWYYTGNLEGKEGRKFGYQFTIFRRALLPPDELVAPENSSAWRSNQVYLAHFTVSDIGNDQFYYAERFSREASGLAGAQAEPYRVWLEDWQVEAIAPQQVRLQAQTEEVTLDLVLQETRPPILHGDAGLSRKGPEPGNASYYYSIIQQETMGTVTVNGDQFQVTGLSWKDHEYSTSALSAGSSGWDWFSLQFDDGSGLMLFEIRRDDGALQTASSGSFIYPDGSTQHLELSQWQLQILDTWTSRDSGAQYPAVWRLQIPDIDLELEGRPLMSDQELKVSSTYWEGAVAFEGSREGKPVNAQGYVEMTGYAGAIGR
ncbi:MAG: lipocalin-like domain-containing protein [Candidatus Promineifilaceae bacterium]|nr:lipocalin-like domain-containing protein [Candidatus Promineifilaceae bacterium]